MNDDSMNQEQDDDNERIQPRRRNLLREEEYSNEIANLEKKIKRYEQRRDAKEEEKQTLELAAREAEERLAALESQLRKVTTDTDKLQRTTDVKDRKKEKTRRGKIDGQVEGLFNEFFSEVDSDVMSVRVSFENHSAVFDLSEHECTQFKHLKKIVAPFFNIKPEEIFFLDKNGVILEQNLKMKPVLYPLEIKPTLYPLKKRIIKGYIPQLTIVLKKYQSMSDYIKARRPKYEEKLEEKHEESAHENITEKYYFNRSAVSNKAEKKQKKFHFLEFIKVMRQTISSSIFLCIVLLWTFSMFDDNRYFQTFLMSSDVPLIVNNPLISGSETSNPNLMILDWVRVIKQPFKTQACPYLNNLYTQAYQRYNLSCYDPTQIDTTSFNIMVAGQTETYSYSTDSSITIDSIYGSVQTQGFTLDLNLNSADSTQDERYTQWTDHFTMMSFESVVMNVYNPSNQLLAQVYIFNQTFNSEVILSKYSVDCVSLESPTNTQLAVRISLIILSSFAILFNILGLIRPVSIASASTDTEILLKQEYSRCIALDKTPPKLPYFYWVINFRRFVLLIYRPTQDQLLTLGTMIGLLANVGLRSQLYYDLSSLEIFNLDYYLDFNYYVNQKNNLLILSAVVSLLLLSTFIKTLKVLLQSIMPEVTYFEEMLKGLVVKLFPVIVMMAYILGLVAIANLFSFGMVDTTYNSFLKAYANAMQVALRSSKTTNQEDSANSVNDLNTGNSGSILMNPVVTVVILVYLFYNLIVVQSTILIEKERTRVQETQGLFDRIKAKGVKIFKLPLAGGPGNIVNESLLTGKNLRDENTANDKQSPNNEISASKLD